MNEGGRWVGMESREYVKDGKKKQFCALHLVYVEGVYSDVMGSRVEEMNCPRVVDCNSLEIGKLYELVYEHYTMKGQKMARVKDLLEVEG